ncbi:hypothetical protein [Methylovulum miyakonense]|uniref:hypothetical protein n=1 Tax=Methylovulum miyakonense TaxID=645578 RepID=UPI0003683976|nr:hypothetical protein [Methylovulum miyakonense]
MSHALTKIKAAGFVVELDGMDLAVSPFSKLTPPQVLFLKAHKAEIIQELKQEKASNDNHAPEHVLVEDDRHYCSECQHLNYLGRCKASPTRYSPADTHPRRCAIYLGIKK